MDRYTEMGSFVFVAEKGGFAAAALVEGVTLVVMGRRLDLFNREIVDWAMRSRMKADLAADALTMGRGSAVIPTPRLLQEST